MRESTFSFWEDTEFNALPGKPLAAADNAYQGRAGEEESWLWEVSSSDGTYLNVFFAVYGKEGKARLFLAQPGKEVITREVTAPFTAAADHLEVQMAGNRIYQQGNLFRLEWRSEEPVLELEFQPHLPGWQPGHGRINYGEKGDKYLFWSVPVPRARVSGSLLVAGQEQRFNGQGYIDHRRYNFPLPRTLGGAILGRYYTEAYTLLWADFWGNLLYSGEHVTALYLARAEEMLAATGNLEVQVFDRQSKGGLSYPAELSLQAGTTPLIRLDIKQTTALSPRLVTTMGAQGFYCRFNGQLKLATRPEEEVTGQGFMETLTARD
ncbi:hypothetical protein MGLY_29280 [Neomoorella glycerini]|uniref:AttH domain-containing protein n=1 Tax=Neomoorella glycerini TaxID=55779 RepID=A0A6I5ZUQ5_9FIRM|nr:hypothetical protein [Moorella glycerini]QGP93516.1 hypothetical protein MGLY_29280 [Moorella glycerini]